MLFIFFSFKPVTVSAVMEDVERCSSNRRPLASVMGTLMVVDPQPAARYHPPNSI
jgi:ribosomal protein S12 methylthiotransferase accessory factor YcaO